MLRAVVFHYNREVRERIVNACRHAGFITYDAVDPIHAFQAAWNYRPDVIITDFPALLDNPAGSRSLTEAIRRAPPLHDIPILNLAGDGTNEATRLATEAGATMTLPPSTPSAQVIATVNDLSRRKTVH